MFSTRAESFLVFLIAAVFAGEMSELRLACEFALILSCLFWLFSVLGRLGVLQVVGILVTMSST
jgi:hypothetical protein